MLELRDALRERNRQQEQLKAKYLRLQEAMKMLEEVVCSAAAGVPEMLAPSSSASSSGATGAAPSSRSASQRTGRGSKSAAAPPGREVVEKRFLAVRQSAQELRLSFADLGSPDALPSTPPPASLAGTSASEGLSLMAAAASSAASRPPAGKASQLPGVGSLPGRPSPAPRGPLSPLAEHAAASEQPGPLSGAAAARSRSARSPEPAFSFAPSEGTTAAARTPNPGPGACKLPPQPSPPDEAVDSSSKTSDQNLSKQHSLSGLLSPGGESASQLERWRSSPGGRDSSWRMSKLGPTAAAVAGVLFPSAGPQQQQQAEVPDSTGLAGPEMDLALDPDRRSTN